MNDFVIYISVVLLVVSFLVYQLYFKTYYFEKKKGYYKQLAEKIGLAYVGKKGLGSYNHAVEGTKGGYFFRIVEGVESRVNSGRRFCCIQVENAQFGTNFTIVKENGLNRMAKKMGFNDFEFGYPTLDDTFNFSTWNEERFKEILTSDIQSDLLDISNQFNGVMLNDQGSFQYQIIGGRVDSKYRLDELTAVFFIMEKMLKRIENH